MALKPNPPVILKFGGGLNTSSSPTSINPTETTSGKNFSLDFQNTQYGRRAAFEKVAEAPNGESIRGFIQLVKSDGTRSFLVQAGGVVYEWDGSSGTSGMTAVQTVNAAARLRGQIEANSVRDDKVIVTDLDLVETVKTWDGTSLLALGHDLGGDLYAKYALIDQERAFLANIISGTATPHLVVASATTDITSYSTADRPSSSLGIGDPWFLPLPNLRPINGLLAAFGKIVLGSNSDNFYQITGTNSKDNALGLLAVDTAGNKDDEGVVFADNDILYGRNGKIDSLGSTAKFGDVETDDITRWIRPDVENITSWRMQYSTRLKRLYAFPSGGGCIFVLHKNYLDEVAKKLSTGEIVGDPNIRVSPWSVWETDHPFNFEPTATMRMLRPTDGVEHIYMGAGDGSLYQLEGTTGGDPGSTDIVTERTSAALTIPPLDIVEVSGWVRYRQGFSGTLNLTFEFGGEQIFDETISVTLDAAANNPTYNASAYYNGTDYYNTSFSGRLVRKRFTTAGRSDQIQVKASVTGSKEFFIEEIGITANQANT